MYTIIKESNGAIEEYSVIDTRTNKTMGGVYATLEEARKAKEKLTRELYRGSGVQGNEI